MQLPVKNHLIATNMPNKNSKLKEGLLNVYTVAVPKGKAAVKLFVALNASLFRLLMTDLFVYLICFCIAGYLSFVLFTNWQVPIRCYSPAYDSIYSDWPEALPILIIAIVGATSFTTVYQVTTARVSIPQAVALLLFILLIVIFSFTIISSIYGVIDQTAINEPRLAQSIIEYLAFSVGNMIGSAQDFKPCPSLRLYASTQTLVSALLGAAVVALSGFFLGRHLEASRTDQK